MEGEAKTLLERAKKNDFSTKKYVEDSLNQIISSGTMRKLDLSDLVNIRERIREKRIFVDQIHEKLESQTKARSKTAKTQDKFAYNRLRVQTISDYFCMDLKYQINKI